MKDRGEKDKNRERERRKVLTPAPPYLDHPIFVLGFALIFFLFWWEGAGGWGVWGR